MRDGQESIRSKPPMRADARRNQQRILDAARAMFGEHGTAAPLDDIARRASVSIATLYRRFPDRAALCRQVAIEGYETVLAEARAAQEVAEEGGPDAPMRAAERFLTGVVDQRSRLVLPLFGGPGFHDEDATALRHRITAALEAVLARGRECGAVRDDVNSIDLLMAAALISRPLPNTPPEWLDITARRHIAVHLDGLRPGATHHLLGPGPGHPEPEHAFSREATATAENAGGAHHL
ncbi:TetR/AcrR family transcriptional regulator [Streptomyces sp. NPDC021098]|uniref:TetR/AcrR family transcriptional regulator n=1 Tax=unclassified Streptomyces TaxID=2593676 RepID=UPI0037B38C22